MDLRKSSNAGNINEGSVDNRPVTADYIEVKSKEDLSKPSALMDT